MDKLAQLIRDEYPFPIAYTHKKIQGRSDNDAQKLKLLIEAAESTIQFLALVMLAQLKRDLEHGQAPPLSTQIVQLCNDLRKPTFGKWHGILRDLLKQYRNHRHLLVVPELFDCYFKLTRGKKLPMQPVVRQAIEPVITLRNNFAHPGIPEAQYAASIASGTSWLKQLLAEVQFLHAYDLAFIQRIEVHPQPGGPVTFRHDLMQMRGCFSIFDSQRWDSQIYLQAGRLILLNEASDRSLFLDPFLVYTDGVPEPDVFDVYLYNGLEGRQATYMSVQFLRPLEIGDVRSTQSEALASFLDGLQSATEVVEEVELEWEGQRASTPLTEDTTRSTEEVYRVRYQRQAAAKEHASPYKFLDYFNPEDAELFFGRDQEIRQLQRLFHNTRLLILHGESGTGKTSLIRAGLMPSLSPETYVPVYVRALQEPSQAIKEAMIHQLGIDRRHINLPLAEFLDAETAHLSKTVVVILDQFEEFFLRFPPEVRRSFKEALGKCVIASHLDVHVVISLRDDYFAHLAEFQDAIPNIFSHEMQLSRLTPAQAVAAAVGPLKQVGMSIEDETLFKNVIVPALDEHGHGIAPPLLQIVCNELYQKAWDAGRKVINREDYESLGDVRQALGQYLERTLRQFGPRQSQTQAVLKSLVTSEGTKQASFLDELGSQVRTMGVALSDDALDKEFLWPLVQSRLVRAEESEGRSRYELAHDFLAQHIDREWVAEKERDLTKVKEMIDRAYEAYQANKLLIQPEALAMIAPYRERLNLSEQKQAFLQLSQQISQKQRRRLWWNIAAGVLVVALLIGGIAGWYLFKSHQHSQHRLVQLYMEQGRQELLQKKPRRAVVYLIEADQARENIITLPIFKNPTERSTSLSLLLKQSISSLYSSFIDVSDHQNEIRAATFKSDDDIVTVSRNGTVKGWRLADVQLFRGFTEPGNVKPQDRVLTASFSPDGKRLATVGRDGTVNVWDATGAQAFRNLAQPGNVAPEDRVRTTAFSPDGTHLVTVSRNGTVNVWDMASKKDIFNLPDPTEGVHAAAFSPDGQRLIIMSRDGTVKVWNVISKQLYALSDRHEGTVRSVAFSPDGKHLATASDDKTVKVRDAINGQLLVNLSGHTDGVRSVAFSADGNRLVSVSRDGTVKVWDATNWLLLRDLPTYADEVRTAALSPNGQRLIIMSRDGTVETLDISNEQSFSSKDDDEISTATFSPDGQHLVTVSRDGTVTMSDVTNKNNENREFLKDFPGSILSGSIKRARIAAFSPDGQHLAIASWHGTVKVWNINSKQPPDDLFDHHKDIVWSIGFSPDGKHLVTANRDKTVKVWDIANGQISLTPRNLDVHTDEVRAVAFSADGSRLVSVGRDGIVKVWDATGWRFLRDFHTDTDEVRTAALSPDGKRLVTVSRDGTMEVWDAINEQPLLTIPSHTGRVHAAILAPNGKLIVTASSDNTVQVWDAINGQLLMNLSGHTDRVRAAAFSPDGKLWTVSRNGRVNDGDVSFESRELKEIKAQVRCLTPWQIDDGRLSKKPLSNCPQSITAR